MTYAVNAPRDYICSMIRVCIIMMHLTRLYLYRIAKAIYGIIISIKFP